MTVPASAQEPNEVPGSRPPSSRERAEEVYDFARGQQAAKPDDPPKPKPVQSFWDRLINGVGQGTERQREMHRLKEIGRSIPRGLANLGNSVVRTAAEAGAFAADKLGVGGTEQEQDARRERAKKVQVVSEEELDAVYGARSDDPVASLTEGLVQGFGSMLLLRGAGLRNLIASGAVTDAVAFNPYESGVSEILAQHGDKVPAAGKLLETLGKAGSVDQDDDFVQARIKRVVEGGVIGGVLSLAVDAARWGTRRVRAERVLADAASTPALKAEAEATIKKADAVLDAIDDGTHVPEGTRVTAKPNGDGSWRVEEVTPDRGFPQDEILGVPAKGEPGTSVHDIGDGGKVIIARNEKGEATGYLQLQQGAEGHDVLDVLVKKENRRQGVATSLYKKATDEGLKPISGTSSLSHEGDLLTMDLAQKNLTFRDTPPNPRFTRAEAVTQAATMDHAVRMTEQPNGAKFSDADVKVHFETAERIKNAPTEQEAIDIVGGEDHFNLGAIASGDDFNAQLRALVSKYKDSFSAAKKRPVVTHEETLKAAQVYAKTLGINDWAARVAKAADDPARLALSVETVLKVSGVRQVGERIADIGAALAARPDDPALIHEARRLLDTWHGLSLEAFEHRSEVGRALNILQAMSDNEASKVRFKGKATETPSGDIAAKSPNGAKPAQPSISANMTPQQIALTTRLFQRSGGQPRQLHAVLQGMQTALNQQATRQAGKGSFARVADWVNTVYINSLISGAKTAQSIFQSGAAMNALEATSRVLAGAGTFNKALAQEGAAYWYAMFRYAKENVSSAASAFREGTSVLEGSAPLYVKSGVTGSLVTVPGRIAGSIDEFTRATAYRAEEFAKSLRAAQQQGLPWSQAVQQAEADVRHSIDAQTGIALNPVALEKAGVPTLSNPLGSNTFMGKISNALAESPYGKLIIPFMRPSVNTFRYVWQNTPVLNLFNKQARQTILAGGEEAAVLHTRSLIAGSLMTYAYTRFAQGEITGDGPSDPTMRKIWLQNHQPYSLKLDGQWVSYRRMEPFASWLGMVADASEAVHELDSDGERQSVMTAVFSAALKNTYNKSWTQGLSQFLDAWGAEDAGPVQRWAKGLVSGFVPQALTQFNDDPYIREAKTVVDGVRSRIPGLSKDLPPKFNVVGEAVMKQGSLWNRNFSTANARSAAPSLLEDTLLENNISLQAYPSKIAQGQIDLLDERWEKNGKLPYVRFMELLREGGLRAELEATIKSERFKNASAGTPTFPGGEREAILKEIKDRHEEKALKHMLKEYGGSGEEKTGLALAYKGATYRLPNAARYKGPDKEAVIREKYGIPVPQ